MFNRFRFPILLTLFLILSVAVLSGCDRNNDLSTPTQLLDNSQKNGDEDLEIGNTATVEPTSEIIEITETPEPTAKLTLTSTPMDQREPTATPDSGDDQVVPEETSEPEEPNPSPTPTEPVVKNDEAPVDDCKEKAAFFKDVTIPDGTFFSQGEEFVKTWRFRNEGTCTWTTDYAAVFHSGDNMSAPIELAFPENVPPDGQVEISIDMKAPTRGGQHHSSWEFKNSAGQHFGVGSAGSDLFWVLINVRFLDQNDEPQPDPSTLPPQESPSGCNFTRDQSYESQVVTLVNKARNQNGLDSLISRGELSASALAHSTDMACSNFVGHSGSDGSHWTDRIAAQGYSPSYATENIYVGFPTFGGTPAGAFDWWMNSQIHRDNILNPKISEIGVGYAFNEQSDYGGYYTINFARP